MTCHHIFHIFQLKAALSAYCTAFTGITINGMHVDHFFFPFTLSNVVSMMFQQPFIVHYFYLSLLKFLYFLLLVILMELVLVRQILGGASSRLPNSHRHEQRRNALSIHEYDAMGLLKKFDIKVPFFTVASTPEEVFKIATELGKI